MELCGVPVIGLIDEVQQYLHHGVEELAGHVLRLGAAAERENIPVGFPTDIQVLPLQELA